MDVVVTIELASVHGSVNTLLYCTVLYSTALGELTFITGLKITVTIVEVETVLSLDIEVKVTLEERNDEDASNN